MTDHASRVSETRTHVLELEPGVRTKQIFLRVTGRQLTEHMLDREPVPANDRLATKDRGVEGDALKELVLTHDVFTLQPADASR